MLKTPYLFLLTFSLFALSNVYFANSTVIGLDLGSEFMKISSITAGKDFFIIEDTTTKRKTPTAIAFYGNERIYEYDIQAKRPKAYQTTFVNLVKFLGKSLDDPKLQEQMKTYLEDYIITESKRGTPSFGLKNFKMGDDDETSYTLTIEELFGMIFRHVGRLAQKQSDRPLKDIVVTVPPFWTFKERYALQDALLLADLNPLAFMSENTGAALYYALERQDNEPHLAIFYNLGSTSLKVSLVEFYVDNSSQKKATSYESFNVLAEAWDEDLGSLNFDLNLLHHFAREFDSKSGRKGEKSVLSSNPAKAKLLKEVNKLKEILSANKQAQIYIENLFESTDFKSTIERTTFEEINSDLFKRLTKPIDEVLERVGKRIKDIHAFELIGGGIRVPKIQQILAEHLRGKEIGSHLNGDESMTLGAAFHAANLSASFKTRQVNLHDGYNFDIRVELRDLEPVENNSEDEGLNKQALLFPYKTRFGSKKILAFEHDGSVNATFYARLPGRESEERVMSFAIKGLKEALQDSKFKDKDLGKTKINLHFRLNSLGLIELAKAEATVEEIILTDPTSKTSTKSTEEGGDDESEKKFKRKTVTHHIPLKSVADIPGIGPMTEDELEKSRDLLTKFDHYEDQKKKIAEAKNKLEAFLYATRDYLEDESFSVSAREEEKELLKQMLEEHSEWLYTDEASTSTHTPFNKKFEEMNKIVSKIRNRLEERLSRPELVRKAKSTLSSLKTNIADLLNVKPWITEEARDKAISQVEEIRDWLLETAEKQDALKHYEDPVLTGSQITSRLDKAKKIYEKIKSTVKPKPAKNETKTSKEDDGETFTIGKDGKYDEAEFKEYLKKMNVTVEDINQFTKNRKTEAQRDSEKNEGKDDELKTENHEKKTEEADEDYTKHKEKVFDGDL